MNQDAIARLNFPGKCQAMFMFRNEIYIFPNSDAVLQKKDNEVIIITNNKALSEIEFRRSLYGDK